MSGIQEFVKRYGHLGDHPQTEEAIRRAEAALGERFPTAVRTFLLEIGMLHEVCLLGLDGFESLSSGVGRTLDLRRRGLIPPHYVVVMGVGNGADYCLDLTRSDGVDCPIVVRALDGVIYDEEADSFVEFLYDRVQILEECEEEEESED